MSWVANEHIRDVEQPVAFKKLLRHACELVYNKYKIFPLPDSEQHLKDDCGPYGKEYLQFIVVAKDRPYGNIVSIHRDAVAQALKRKVKILFYLDSARKLYDLDPSAVIRNEIDENRKGPALMINFSVKVLEGEVDVKTKRKVSRLDPEKCQGLKEFSPPAGECPDFTTKKENKK